MVQVFLIMARQMSKPVADYFMRYGKDHPIFRNKVLIPVGRSLVQMATRLRMRNLGLGAPTTVAPVSEAAALEQASDLIQQIVIFGYSVGVFAGYYYYQKANEKETVDFKHLDELKSNFDLKIWNLNRRIDDLESKLKSQSLIPSFLTRSQSESAVPAEPQPIPNAVSSIPFDEALAILKNTPRW
uniref:OPA3-like protein CG13603 n=1 Tax=Panagrellus redivivus TaxID=6233 RepID=A0A7E4VF32_PANRE